MPSISNFDSLSSGRQELFIGLYKKAFPAVARYISRMGGSFDEAKDVFQDALIVYYEKVVVATLSLNAGDTAYLVGIAKYLWVKRYKENCQHIPLDGIDIVLDQTEESPSGRRLMHLLEMAGRKCMDLLKSFYYDQVPLADAAALFGFSGVRSATVQKYKCLEKVRETIKEKSLTYAYFLD
ncbi:MAG: polymerase subunit sigma-70 [Mucilaginibacter sp.]|nr:polymerase subunit sigma-70 [Mucilaginibacter sp.]